MYCVVDGQKVYLEQLGDKIIYIMFYNGWKRDNLVANVFVFVANGAVIHCDINYLEGMS